MPTTMRWICILLLALAGCSKNDAPTEPAPRLSGSTITGQVIDKGNSAPVPFVRVSLMASSRVRFVLTDASGRFTLTGITPGEYRLIARRQGYDSLSVDVPQGARDSSVVSLRLVRKAGVPAVKPLSKGIFRISQKRLEQDFNGDGIYQTFTVMGAAYAPTAIGGYGYDHAAIDRSMLYLDSLNANVIRTYAGADPYLLMRAEEHGVGVIVSFWVDGSRSLADPGVREAIIGEFAGMVNALKTYPAVLLWNIGNEQNYNFRPGEDAYWYDLVQELAITSFEIEGDYYHPVCASNGDLINIGDAAKRASDSDLTYMDLWGSNIYKGNLTSSFAAYRSRTQKALVITEFGIDALDNRSRLEYENMQAWQDSLNWLQIRAASDVCVGATVFEFTDEWWKAGDPSSHDFGGYASSEHPDGYSNEEWWGLIAVTPDANGDGKDEWRPRQAFRMFARVWQ